MRNNVLVACWATAAVAALTACSAARQFDTAPSVTGKVPSALLAEPEYPAFVAQWMGSQSTASLPPGAIANYTFRIEPPTRAGYRRVGGKELDDAVQVFEDWCRANGGRSRRLGYADRDGVERSLLTILQRSAAEVPEGAYTGCERGTIVIAVLRTHLNVSVTDQPALLTVTHFTQPKIAQAVASKQEAARATASNSQQAASNLAAVTREQDAAYRKNLKVGDRVRWDRDFGSGFSARGLVVEMRAPIALIQFDNVTPSPQWVHIEQLRRP